MNDMVIVSICAGNRDVIINPELVDLAPIAPPSHAFTVFTTAMPTVWTSMDHQAIVWCKQVARKLVSSLIAAVDVSRPERTLVREKRIVALEAVLQSPLLRTRAPRRSLASLVDRPLEGYREVSASSPFSEILSKSRLLLVPALRPGRNDTFTLFTDLEADSELKIYLATRIVADQGEVPLFRVNKITQLAITLPYQYLFGSSGSPQFVSHLALDSSHLSGYDFIAIEAKPAAGRRFLAFDFVDPGEATVTLNHTLADLFLGVDHVFGPGHALHPTLRLENAINNLYSYNVFVSQGQCGGKGKSHFFPLVRQYTSTASEEQYRLVTNDSVPAKILFHGFNSPMGAISKFRVRALSSLDFSLEDNDSVPGGAAVPHLVSHGGVYLQFWLDPSCAYEVHMQLDWFGTAGQIARRYFPVGVTFPFAILCFCFGLQLNEWEARRQFPSTTVALSRQVSSVRKFLIFFTLVSSVQANFEWLASNFSRLSGSSRSAVLFNANLLMDSVFLGNDDTVLLLPILFLLSFGVAFFVNFLLKTLVLLLSLPLRLLATLSSRFAERFFVSRRAGLGLFLSLKLPLLVFAYFGPYHLALVFTFVYHLMTCVYSSVRWAILNNVTPLSPSLVCREQCNNTSSSSSSSSSFTSSSRK